MKITGIILIMAGLVAGALCMVQVIQPTPPNREAVPIADDQIWRPNMTLPLAVSAAAVVIGGLMVIYGGRGYFISNNPRVRN